MHHSRGPAIVRCYSSSQVWVTNVIAFGLIYWELDRGGPVRRAQSDRDLLPLADFRFTQDETHYTVVEVAAGSSKKSDRIPSFVDYRQLTVVGSVDGAVRHPRRSTRVRPAAGARPGQNAADLRAARSGRAARGPALP